MIFAQKCRRAYKLLKQNRFKEDDRGVTVIEFALLALPFFAIIGAILETGITLLASQVLDSAVHDASRIVRTGEAQHRGYNMPEFRSQVCGHTFGLFDCNKIKFRVATIKSFANAKADPPVDKDGKWVISSSFRPGKGNDVVLVEAYYKWPTMLNILGFKLGHVNGDRAMLMSASRVFMNEPFN